MSRGALVVSNVRLVPGTDTECRRGLLGYLSLQVNGQLHLDGLTLRRSSEGRLFVAYPARRDAHGRDHALVRPRDEDVRRELERQVFEALGIQEAVS